MAKFLRNDARLSWLFDADIRPYVFVRSTQQPKSPGQAALDWFTQEPLLRDPQRMAEGEFTSQILRLENTVFGGAGLAMPRWVFYDCAVMPGVTTGFAIRREAAPPEVLAVTQPEKSAEWVPLSLFCIIPTMTPTEWVAHNLSSINSALPEELRYYGLGFLSKAFGLWYANIETCCGMTQWRGAALRLHSHYGHLEVLTAYTPSHSYATTLTYRLQVEAAEWPRFFAHELPSTFSKRFSPTGQMIERAKDTALIELQARIEQGEGPYFLNATEIRDLPLEAPLNLYRRN